MLPSKTLYRRTQTFRLFLALCAVLTTGAVSGCRASANFHVVQENALYRSAQLSAQELEQAIDVFGIKTVINLRGAEPGEDWYDRERDVTSSRNVELIDVALKPNEIPPRPELVQLLDAFKTAKRPILVHCKVGADRTGEASALYQMEYMGKTKEEALRMLTPAYRHFELFVPAPRYFIRLYQGQEWAYQEYDPCKQQDLKYFDRSKHCK